MGLVVKCFLTQNTSSNPLLWLSKIDAAKRISTIFNFKMKNFPNPAQPRHLNLVVMDRIPFTASGICERFNRIFSAFICCLFCIFFIFLLLSGFLCYFCKHIVDAVFFFLRFYWIFSDERGHRSKARGARDSR